MDVNYNEDVKEIVNNKFDFLEIIPVALGLIDIDEGVLVKSNTLFSKITNLNNNKEYDLNELIIFSDIFLEDLLNSSLEENICFMVFKNEKNEAIPLLIQTKKYFIDDRNFLLCSFENVLKNYFEGNETIINANLQKSEKKNIFNNIFDNMPLFTAVVSLDKELLYSNNKCNKIFENEIKNKNLGKEFFGEIKGLNNFHENYLNIHLESLIGFRWFSISITPIIFNNKKSIILMGEDITKFKNLENKLLKSVTKDTLTNTYTKQSGVAFLEEYIDKVLKGEPDFTVSYIRINDVKNIRKNFGNEEGDNNIIKTVDVIRNSIRQTDILTKIYDDEFIVIFPNCKQEIVENIMTTISSRVDYLNTQQDLDYKHSISFGIFETNKTNAGKLDSNKILDSASKRII